MKPIDISDDSAPGCAGRSGLGIGIGYQKHRYSPREDVEAGRSRRARCGETARIIGRAEEGAGAPRSAALSRAAPIHRAITRGPRAAALDPLRPIARELPAERLEATRLDRRARLAHQVKVEVQVVHGIESRAEDFVDPLQVVQVGAAELRQVGHWQVSSAGTRSSR